MTSDTPTDAAGKTVRTDSARKRREDTSAFPIIGHLEKLRQNLLDIGVRNRLISAPLKNTRANVLEIIDERADHVFGALRDGSSFLFLANPTAQEETRTVGDGIEGDSPPAIYIPPSDTPDEGKPDRHKDNNLQTRLQAEPLQRRLLTLQHDSDLLEEEQGANVLFLAIGFLKWFEADNSDVERFAPLLLVPVKLERDRVRSRFRLKRRDDDVEVNLSLQAKLKQDFGIVLPDLPEDEDWQAGDYFSLVDKCISMKKSWLAERDSMLLGFFSFSKFLLYRDLDVEAWPKEKALHGHDLVNGLLFEGFNEPPLSISEDANLDDLLTPGELGHVLDADSSQATIIKMASDGRNLVVQGPPGTGKSQTIANIIAAAARQGKSILFVAEKMAALGVVHERLKSQGLDALCLELHSQKANKRAVFEELKRTIELGRVANASRDVAAETQQVRDRLNTLSKLLHSSLEGFAETPFQVLALLVGFRERQIEPPDFKLDLLLFKSSDQHRVAQAALEALASRTKSAGPSRSHPWRGVRRRLSPIDVQRLAPLIFRLTALEATLYNAVNAGTTILGQMPDNDALAYSQLLEWLRAFSDMPGNAAGILVRDPVRADPRDCLRLLEQANTTAKAYAKATSYMSEVGLSQDWQTARQAIAATGRSLFRFLSGRYRRAVSMLDSVSIVEPANDYHERLNRLDAAISYQLAAQRLGQSRTEAEAAFGKDWRGHETETAIDLGVKDSASANSYLLGVECDGATYHSALWARERDRLRQQVLESKGWRLHRIWSTDWFHRPEAEFRKLLVAIDQAKVAQAVAIEAEQEVRQLAVKIEREPAKDEEEHISVAYQEADIPFIRAYAEPHLVPPGLMANYVRDVVAIEQPIHIDEVAKRVARAWGAQRTGTRIRANVEDALKLARKSGKVEGGPFWSLPGHKVYVRDRSGVSSASLRDPDYIAPIEIECAIRQVISRSVAIGIDELAKGVADTFGFGTTSAPFKTTVQNRVRVLRRKGELVEADGLFKLGAETT